MNFYGYLLCQSRWKRFEYWYWIEYYGGTGIPYDGFQKSASEHVKGEQMNFQNLRIEQVTSPNPDWVIYGEFYSFDGVKLGDFGTNGTSVSQWFPQQSYEFQYQIVLQFIQYMAAEIAKGTSS